MLHMDIKFPTRDIRVDVPAPPDVSLNYPLIQENSLQCFKRFLEVISPTAHIVLVELPRKKRLGRLYMCIYIHKSTLVFIWQ